MKKSAFAVIVSIFPFLLPSVVPVVAHSQEQSENLTPIPDAGVVSSKLNPEQIALLHWYHANQTTSFPAGGQRRFKLEYKIN